jgi:regulator of nucleoside diphosphate kinase
MKPLTHDIVLTRFDHHRLHGLLRVFRERSAVNPWNLDALELELSRARTVAAHAIPPDVVTMNSTVALRNLVTGERTSLTLAFPDAWAHRGQCVSVLSPLGLALLGCRVGDIVERAHAAGPVPLRIETIEYQPEAEGNFCM